jgi:RNA polymerase sigma-70 factor (ECF subfamily)
VLQWKALEVAELLATTVASVNSALQRARATLAEHRVTLPGQAGALALSDQDQTLLARYLEAFERYDIEALVLLLHEDATLSMPPYNLWVAGSVEVGRWMLGPGAECQGSRVVPTVANGSPAFGQYRASGPEGQHEPWSLTVLQISGGLITEVNAFLDTARLFPLFGLPDRLDN